MQITQAIILGGIQGLTEFIPVSSSGHLVLAEHFLGLDTANLLSFDIIVHAGTLVALAFLFWREWLSILRGNFKLLAYLIVATIPAVIFGLAFKDILEESMRSVQSVAIAFFCVGVYFWLVENYRKNQKLPQEKNWKHVIGMGFAQALAIIPGVSRSGTTVSTGHLLGLERGSAASFSFLMLMPVAAGALVLVVLKGEASLPPAEISWAGFLTSAIVSFFTAKYMLAFFRKSGLKIFAYYLLCAGILLMCF